MIVFMRSLKRFVLMSCLLSCIPSFAQTLEEDAQSFIQQFDDVGYINDEAHDAFLRLLVEHPESFDYSFEILKNEWNKVSQFLNIVTSDDNKLRFYEHVDGSLCNATIIAIQYKTDNGIVLLKNPYEIKDDYSYVGATTISLRRIGEGRYVSCDYNRLSSFISRCSETIFSIKGNTIDVSKTTSYFSSLFIPGTPYNPLEDFNLEMDSADNDLSDRFITSPIPAEGDGSYYESSGIFEIIDRNNGYKSIRKVCNPNYHSSAKGYKQYAVHFKTSGFCVHIDLMPDGSYRYISWKASQQPSDVPRIVVNGGHFDKEARRFTFYNNGYIYCIGYESVNTEQGFHW